MSLPCSLLLMMSITGTLLLDFTGGQQVGYHLSFMRVQVDMEVNHVLLKCIFAFNNSIAVNANFYRNDELCNDLPRRRNVSGQGVTFIVDRQSEGDFTCGESGLVSDPPQTIVALPDTREDPRPRTSYADVNSIGRLDCSITPGPILSHLYYVTWRNASDHSMIFYEMLPPRSTGRRENTSLSDRYWIDPQNFSLFISDVEISDMDDYQCVLGVVERRPGLGIRPHEYTRTRDVNISLFVFNAPRFSERPRSQVVSSGTTVTFACSVTSSPQASSITWQVGGRTVDQRDEPRLTVRTDLVMMRGRKSRTNSSLTISNATGTDSSLVQCVAEYSDDDSVVSTVISEAMLNVLDAVQLNPPISFESGGFILPIISDPLLIPVNIELLFTDADNPERHTPLQSVMTYYNTSVIQHIVFKEQLPSYRSFYFGVAIFYKDIRGPMFHYDNVYSCNDTAQVINQPEGQSDYFAAFLALLISLVLVVFAIIAILIASKLKRKLYKSSSVEAGEAAQNIQQTITNINPNITLCACPVTIKQSDGNGFNEQLAKSLVTDLEKVVRFYQEDDVIKKELEGRMVIKITDRSASANSVEGKLPDIPKAISMK